MEEEARQRSAALRAWELDGRIEESEELDVFQREELREYLATGNFPDYPVYISREDSLLGSSENESGGDDGNEDDSDGEDEDGLEENEGDEPEHSSGTETELLEDVQ